jgi:hypothetical protein
MQTNPIWLRLLLSSVRQMGNRFYHFKGLDHFRAKMHPLRWEPIHLIVNRRRFTPITLHATAAAFVGGSLSRAAMTEVLRRAHRRAGKIRTRFGALRTPQPAPAMTSPHRSETAA